MKEFKEDFEVWDAERTRLLQSVSSANRLLSDKLYEATKKIIEDFEEETGYSVMGVDVTIGERRFFGESEPKFMLSNVLTELYEQKKLRREL